MTDLRVGIAGFGLAGATFHAPLIAATPGLRVAAVVTRDPARRDRALAEHPGVVVHATVEDMIRQPLDLVVVANANTAHVATATAAIEWGIPVVVDKPLATDTVSARELVARADAAGVPLVPFLNRRWDGDFLTVLRLRDEGALGTITRLESRFERWRPQIKPGWREETSSAEGGGTLLDLGPHLVDQAVQLLGPVTSVYAEVRAVRPDASVDDDAFVALTHAGGAVSHLWASAVAAHLGPRFRVLGTSAAYVKHGMDPQEDALRRGERPGEGWGGEPASAYGEVGAGDTWRPAPTVPGDYPAFYRGVAALLRDGAPAPVAAADAVEGLRILDAARESAATSAVVPINREATS